MPMPQSLAKILIHTVFSTKDRRPLLRDRLDREELHRYLGGILAHLDCQPIIVGGAKITFTSCPRSRGRVSQQRWSRR